MNVINLRGTKLIVSDLRVEDDLTVLDDATVTGTLTATGGVSSGGAEARTASADGTGTGAITAKSSTVTVTSAAATNQISLPALASHGIGMSNAILITVGANGYELITPASSNATINLVDGDGTNQLDVAANTTIIAIPVSATAWLAIQVAAATITVVAPDND
jgi:hypothetical protein